MAFVCILEMSSMSVFDRSSAVAVTRQRRKMKAAMMSEEQDDGRSSHACLRRKRTDLVTLENYIVHTTIYLLT